MRLPLFASDWSGRPGLHPGSCLPWRQSVRDFRLHQLAEQYQRFLPAQVAQLDRDHLGYAFLHHMHFGAAGDSAKSDGGGHLARQVGVFEAIVVADALARHEFPVGAAEAVAIAAGEVAERHPVAAADPGVELVHLAGEAVRRQPLGDRVGVEEGAVDPLGRGAQHAVETEGVAGHDGFLCRGSGLAFKSALAERMSICRNYADRLTTGVNPPKIMRLPSKGILLASAMRGSFMNFSMPASRVALSGHSTQENTTDSSFSACTARRKSVSLPSGTLSPQHSTTRVAPNSTKTASKVLACAMNCARLALGTAITKPSM